MRARFSLPFVRTIGDILKVRLGEYDVSTTAEPLRHEEFNISSIVIHPRCASHATFLLTSPV